MPTAGRCAAVGQGPAPLAMARMIPLGALLFGAAALAYGGIFVRQSELSPTASAVYRVAFAIPVLFAGAAALRRRDAPPVSRRELLAARGRLIAVGFIFSGNLALYHWSIALTTLANSALLANLAPLFVVLGAWLVFGKRISGGFALGLVTALTGAVVLIGARAEFGATHMLGGVLGLATAVFYGAYLLAVSRVRAQFNTWTVMAWSSTGTLIVLLPVTLAMGESVIPRTGHGVLILLALALISHVGGQGAIAYALAHLPAALGSVTLLVQPVMAAAFGWVAYHEYPQPLESLGGIVVLAGIVIARRSPQ